MQPRCGGSVKRYLSYNKHSIKNEEFNKDILAFSLRCNGFSACSDWTEAEAKDGADLTHTNKSEAYYAQLRDYKKTDHSVAFGWFGNWTGTGVTHENSLAGLPD